MRRLAVSSAVAASLLAAVSLLTACGSGAHRGYSVSTVKAAFRAQGVDLHPFHSEGGKPTDAKWIYLIGSPPHLMHVNIRLGPLTGIYKRVTNQMAAPGWDAKQYRNVLVVSHAGDRAVVTAALHRLK
jgi:hypothetical protein